MSSKQGQLSKGLKKMNFDVKHSKGSLKSSFSSKQKNKKHLSSFHLDKERPSLVTPFLVTSTKEVKSPLGVKGKHSKSKSISVKAKDLSDFTLQYRPLKKVKLGDSNRLSFFLTPKSNIKKKKKATSPHKMSPTFTTITGMQESHGLLDSMPRCIGLAAGQQKVAALNTASKHARHATGGPELKVAESFQGALSSVSPIHSRHLSFLNPSTLSMVQPQRLYENSNNALRLSSPKIINRSQLKKLHSLFQKKKTEGQTQSSKPQISTSPYRLEIGQFKSDQSVKYKQLESPLVQSTQDINQSRSEDKPKEVLLRFRFEDRDKVDHLDSTDRFIEPVAPATKYTEATRRDFSRREDESPNDSVARYLQNCKFNFDG